MLILEKSLGKGAVRECYEHPADKTKCVKVLLPNADPTIFQKEYENYSVVKDVLGNYIIPCEKELVETNKGLGMICDRLIDDDGLPSKMIFEIQLDDEIREGLNSFFKLLLDHNLFFYDFNLHNFAIQIKNGKKQLKYIDLKSFRHNHSWCFLKLENVSNFLARIIIIRRMKRVYGPLRFEIPSFLNHNETHL